MPQVVDETGIVIQDPDLDPAEMKYREVSQKFILTFFFVSRLVSNLHCVLLPSKSVVIVSV